MVEARWKGTLIASGDDAVIVEGNHYFRIASVDASRLRPSTTTTICSWKGETHCYDI